MREHKLDLERFAAAVERFGEKGTGELATVMGDYVMAGIVLTAIDQHLPEDRPTLLPARSVAHYTVRRSSSAGSRIRTR